MNAMYREWARALMQEMTVRALSGDWCRYMALWIAPGLKLIIKCRPTYRVSFLFKDPEDVYSIFGKSFHPLTEDSITEAIREALS